MLAHIIVESQGGWVAHYLGDFVAEIGKSLQMNYQGSRCSFYRKALFCFTAFLAPAAHVLVIAPQMLYRVEVVHALLESYSSHLAIFREFKTETN